MELFNWKKIKTKELSDLAFWSVLHKDITYSSFSFSFSFFRKKARLNEFHSRSFDSFQIHFILIFLCCHDLPLSFTIDTPEI